MIIISTNRRDNLVSKELKNLYLKWAKVTNSHSLQNLIQQHE